MQNMTQESENKEIITSVKNIFKPSAWLTKIDFINHLVLFNNALAVVLAEEGGGKTTFVELLQTSLDAQIKAQIIKAIPPFNQTSLLLQLATTFHLRTDTELTTAKIIEQINERKAHILLIIDDAQHVSDTFLQEVLLELKQQGEQGYFHICLVSDFSLVASLNKLEAASLEHLIHRIEPGALTESETKTYLLSNLPALKRIDQTMSDKRLAQFYQLTGGNIARINKEMTNYFCPELKSVTTEKSSASKYIGLTATLTVALLASVYIWQNQDLFKQTTPSSQESERVAIKQQQLPSVIAQAPTMQREEPALVSQLPSYNKGMTSYIPALHISAVRQEVQPPPLRRVVDISLDEEEVDNSLVVMDKVVVIPKTITSPQIKQVANLERNVVSSRETPKPMRQPSLATTNNVVASKVPEAKVERYTVQLLASQNLEDVKRFINLHHLTDSKIRTTKSKGANWYVLTIGEYGRVEQAQQVAKNLPTTITQFKPWIRSTSGLPALG
ncbi:SPOR domain-containing protein [Legionella cardiaca]|uniref:SPOR domain-containing protein n=1 Tax=Legionella cardiaca TaxID=1071983 RepID=A0ABY8AWH2_9GAMM|nr:AAA family ATPase [Legionella cardiaca]WED43840.1 SPOR domain-containing protein [Legionella cardiaca]